jgi:hypothetical protein
MEPRDTPQGTVALAFARALADGEHAVARGMLSRTLRAELTERAVQAEFEEMIDYGAGPADFVDVMNVLDDWPGRRAEDIGWAYCAIAGNGYSEAVAVIVAWENDQHVIREIEWGRP